MSEPKITVTIRTDSVETDPKKIQRILDRVARIVSGAYQRKKE